jgi:hypothetical protein
MSDSDDILRPRFPSTVEEMIEAISHVDQDDPTGSYIGVSTKFINDVCQRLLSLEARRG